MSFSLNAQNFNRPTPFSFNKYEFQGQSTSLNDYYYLVAPYKQLNTNQEARQETLYILDENGYIAWMTQHEKKHFDFKYHPDFNRYSFTRIRQGQRIHYEVNDQFELVDSTVAINGVIGDIHEFQIFPNGNRCIIGVNQHFNVDLSGYTFYNGATGTASNTVVSAVIQEFDPNGNLIFEWDSFDHLTPDYFASGPYNSANFDYVHPNAIELDTSDNNLLLSMKTANLICKIDHITGDVIWRLNGNFSDFTYPNDTGFSGQHDVRVLPNGNITLFDNDYGNNNPRGVEYSIDINTMEATKVNEWPYTSSFYSNSLGSFRRISQDYHIVGWGNTRRPEPSVTLFDGAGEIATDIFFEDTVVTYRAFMQQLPNFPERPQINCEIIEGSFQLSVSESHNSVYWSTGEVGPTIEITQPGEYQCWVNHGIGMLGSYPISIDDFSSCSTNSLNENDESISVQIKYFDILGRRINNPQIGSIYIVIKLDNFGKETITKEFLTD